MKKALTQIQQNLILSCKGLNYSIGYKKILKDISIEIFQNEIVLLCGDNGSGKSTLLKLIFHHKFNSGFFQTDESLRVGYFGHELGLYSSLSLEENLRYFSAISGKKTQDKNLESYLELFNLKKRVKDPVCTFSRGMKQKAGILCAIASSPQLLLLDEPTSGLDEKSRKVFLEFILDFKKNGSVFWVTHETNIENKFKDRTYFLSNGELIK